jgi:hypothetical protein
VITISMAAVIDSGRDRVWRALTDPAEVVAWDERMLALIDEPPSLPLTDCPLRWRYRLGPVQTVLSERAHAVVPPERLCAERRVGSLRFEQTFSLAEEPGHTPRTRLAMKVVADNRVPVLGDVVDRFAVRRMATEHIDQTLRSVRRWCESHR